MIHNHEHRTIDCIDYVTYGYVVYTIYDRTHLLRFPSQFTAAMVRTYFNYVLLRAGGSDVVAWILKIRFMARKSAVVLCLLIVFVCLLCRLGAGWG